VNGAIAHFKRAVELKPDCMEARLNLGLAYVERGCNVEALEQAEVASRSATQPSFPHHLLGVLLARCGCTEAARICFDAHLERDPDDREGVRLLLSGLGHVPLPERASSAHLDRIYADRATYWDRAKGDTMGYRGADLVASVLDRLAVAGAQLDILDAGCGTGLVGGLVAKKARRLIGVDMSGPMLAKAKEKGVYHGLHQGDLVAFLNANAEGFDVVTCAATLIHFGDLRPAFAAAAACLRDRGLFILTLFPDEKNEDGFASGSLDGYAQGGCFSHGRGYVARTAEATGFMVETLELGVHEYFQKQPRMGLVVALRRLARGQAQARAACLDSSEAPTAPAAGDGMTANGVIEPA